MTLKYDKLSKKKQRIDRGTNNPIQGENVCFWREGWEGSIESSVTQLGAIWKFVGTFLLIVIPGDAGSQWWKARSAKLL